MQRVSDLNGVLVQKARRHDLRLVFQSVSVIGRNSRYYFNFFPEIKRFFRVFGLEELVEGVKAVRVLQMLPTAHDELRGHHMDEDAPDGFGLEILDDCPRGESLGARCEPRHALLLFKVRRARVHLRHNWRPLNRLRHFD